MEDIGRPCPRGFDVRPDKLCRCQPGSRPEDIAWAMKALRNVRGLPKNESDRSSLRWQKENQQLRRANELVEAVQKSETKRGSAGVEEGGVTQGRRRPQRRQSVQRRRQRIFSVKDEYRIICFLRPPLRIRPPLDIRPGPSELKWDPLFIRPWSYNNIKLRSPWCC
ncbi:hypothetical protein NA56DRAFT_90480 [Hyaloscypha hepaticicola]|uniref:Uncharacterized protein n=1 Tax=Hyaloscypha hepaticicola TaxID=2082293 RepID=A0A2J6Q8H3_9HELO|nr:hypothetical protein NA56DRAFT_90480 [Hyaloscypha hepaticicola]